MSRYKYYVFNKPYNVLSQFTKEVAGHITLADYLDIERDVYPIGRLDRDSEGILLLTNDNRFKNDILDPKEHKSKTYIVQVDGAIDKNALRKLKDGVDIKLKKGVYKTKPCQAYLLEDFKMLDRDPPIRIRKNIPAPFIEITITEGKNRQVRKMCASVGFPCLRLVRTKINGLDFPNLELGKSRTLTQPEIDRLRS